MAIPKRTRWPLLIVTSVGYFHESRNLFLELFARGVLLLQLYVSVQCTNTGSITIRLQSRRLMLRKHKQLSDIDYSCEDHAILLARAAIL